MSNPCKGCQSEGKCSGSCWITEMRDEYQAVEEEAKTPEGKMWMWIIRNACVPVTRSVEFRGRIGAGY